MGRPGIEPGVLLSDGVTIRDRTLRSATQRELPARCEYGALGRIRTPDLTVRSGALYPTELPRHKAATQLWMGAQVGNTSQEV